MAKRLNTLIVLSGSLPPELNSCTELLGDLVGYAKRHGVQVAYCGLRRGGRFRFFFEEPDPFESRYGIEYRASQNVVIRLVQELLLPYVLVIYLKLCKVRIAGELILSYSPPVTLTPLSQYFWRCSNYSASRLLVLRDDFPLWAKDVGVVKGVVTYWLLDRLSAMSRRASDAVGCQSILNTEKAKNKDPNMAEKYFFLQNWRTPTIEGGRTNNWIAPTSFMRRQYRIVYAGTIGESQGTDFFNWIRQEPLSEFFFEFHFIGNVSKAIRSSIEDLVKLNRIYLHRKVNQGDLITFIESCDAGLLLLDSRHTTNNIPGKYLLYLDCKIPIVGMLNPNNELKREIEHAGIGFCLDSDTKPVVLRNWLEDYFSSDCGTKKSHFNELLQKKYHTKIAVDKVIEKSSLEKLS